MPGRVLLFAGLFAFYPLLGCGKDLADEITEHKAKVVAKLDQIKQLQQAAKSAPLVTDDHAIVGGPPPLMPANDYSISKRSNTAVVYLEDLERLEELGNVPFRMDGTGAVNRCASTLTTHREPYDPVIEKNPPAEVDAYRARGYFEYCEELRYLFVIRSLAFSSPGLVVDVPGACPVENAADAGADAGAAADAGAGAGLSCKRFVGGKLEAEVLVFDIPSQKQLGGFRFTVDSSRRIDVSLDSEPKLAAGPDFRVQVRAAFLAKARTSVPSFDIGY